MSELSDGAKRLIAATADADDPTEKDERRVVAALALALAAEASGAATAAAATTAAATTAAASTGGSTAGGGTAAVTGGVLGISGAKVVALVTVVGAAWVSGAVITSSAPPSETRAAPAPTPAPREYELELELDAPPGNAPRAVPVTPEPSRVEPAPAPRSAPRALNAAAEDTLHEEVAWLADAESLLRAGDGEGALTRLQALRARHPRGQLAREADVLRVEAMCALGRGDDAQRVAIAIRTPLEGTPLGRRLADTCVGGP